ncbi:MAG TPA: hypothetical protein VJM31_02285 [Vicinamibacterales bacterium]|nr:hypothetical protein [Vicinamibacterales bacterium]
MSESSDNLSESVNASGVVADWFGKREHRNQWNPYTNRDEIVDEICLHVASGMPVSRVLRMPSMPSDNALRGWIAADEEVAAKIRRAREIGCDTIADEALDIADGRLPIGDGPQDASRDKLRIETRLKLLGKWYPKVYGDSTQLRHADADGNKLDTAPLVTELLALLPGGTQPAPPAEPKAPAVRLVRESAYDERATPSARPVAYRPRVARDDVDDLV